LQEIGREKKAWEEKAKKVRILALRLETVLLMREEL
jgi:hypothetical protein